MGYSGIGGQAVMEGVMMKNGEEYAVAVRKPDGEIAIEKKEYHSIVANPIVKKIPFLRGVISFLDSLIIGMGSLMFSASFFEEETEGRSQEEKKKQEDKLMAGTVFISIAAAIVIFMLIPYFLSRLLSRWDCSETVIAIAEGVFRLAIFLLYIIAISLLEDIQRVFMYHGAEHKCINCIEHGLELNVENVKKSSRLHKRCGTSFLFLVVLISIIFFTFIRSDVAWVRFSLRIVLVPVIAGVAFECIRIAGRSDHPAVRLMSQPGLWLQRLTTREPDEQMIEVGIASVEAVFDWKSYIKELDE